MAVSKYDLFFAPALSFSTAFVTCRTGFKVSVGSCGLRKSVILLFREGLFFEEAGVAGFALPGLR